MSLIEIVNGTHEPLHPLRRPTPNRLTLTSVRRPSGHVTPLPVTPGPPLVDSHLSSATFPL